MTLDEYVIIQAVEHRIFGELLRQFAWTEVFLAIESCNEDDPLQVQTTRTESGNMVICYTSKKNAELASVSGRVGGIPLIKAVEMLYGAPELDGLLLQSDGAPWFAVYTHSLQDIFEHRRINEITLNEYVIQNANHGGNFELQQFFSTEVYLAIESCSENLKSGPLTITSGVIVQTRSANLPDIGYMALCYTSKENAILSSKSGKFAGIPLKEAAEMTCKIPEVEGLLIQSDSDAWLATTKLGLRQMFKLF